MHVLVCFAILVIVMACASCGRDVARDADGISAIAEVLNVSEQHDSYSDGSSMWWVIVSYRIVKPDTVAGELLEKHYPLKSPAGHVVGRTVEVEFYPSQLK